MPHRLLFAGMLLFGSLQLAAAEPQPNVLWITSEDHGPHLGCYGDAIATTPNIDALAARGLRYEVCWSNAPVCAVARSTLILGLHATSTGAQHMRSMVPMPAGTKMYPAVLREAGYYCTNNSKEDYNLIKSGSPWDESSNKAHWRGRKDNQPFFAIFNSTKSHESQIRTRRHKGLHDPTKVSVPAYHPDTKEVREDWARYYDQVTAADADAGKVLQQLQDDGLAEATIVFYFADHGSGMPRSKRFPFNSGLHVPLVAYFPEKFKHLVPPEYKPGGASERLVSFVDFAPTLLSICGIEPPVWMQGRAFAGPYDAGPQKVLFGYRDRMDERYDLIRSVRDQRYVYIRNYLPHLPYGQHVAYMFETPTTQTWKRLHDEGKLNAIQDAFWNKKPAEELYDLESDPNETQNQVNSSQHRDVLLRLRAAHVSHMHGTRDLGLLPESDLFARLKADAPFDMARDDMRFPVERILQAASLASSSDADAVMRLRKMLEDDDAAVRYWAAMGLLMREQDGVAGGLGELTRALADASPAVRIVAAEAIVRFGEAGQRKSALTVITELSSPKTNGALVSIAALNAADRLGGLLSDRGTFAKMPAKGPSPHVRYDEYAPRLLRSIQSFRP